MRAHSRIRLSITGAVQGVGFRPHVFRLATQLNLSGFVANGPAGVTIEAQGDPRDLESFVQTLRSNPPPNAYIHGWTQSLLPVREDSVFHIASSDSDGVVQAFLLPDLALCADCRNELFDPGNRRYGYPFTNCTVCGPRYSIVESLPYDRPRTSMRHFPMCPACEAEYKDPSSRRFHAQTNCCPECGPQLSLPVQQVLDALRAGAIVAVKAIGGYLLMCDATNDGAVRRLRERKRRPRKPFALLAAGLEDAARLCPFDSVEAALLTSPAAPIVLMRRRSSAPVSELIAPQNPYLGVMLPSSGIHALLASGLGKPLVATSGNITDEPIAIDNDEAVTRLSPIADLFLHHDRPILRAVDDSVAHVVDGRPALLRRARGFAPLPFDSPWPLEEAVATGAHMKNTVAFSRGRLLWVSQHLGDLDLLPGIQNHGRALADFTTIYSVRPKRAICDLHPGYSSTRSAESLGLPLARVQHHEAHAWAALLEAQWTEPCAVLAWDGTGDGGDNTVWGGEFFLFDGSRMSRRASLRPFRLAGGEAAVRDPRRCYAGVLHALARHQLAAPLFAEAEWKVISRLLDSGSHAPLTSSMGRLFDALAAAHGILDCSFEGEAAMRLEWLALEESPDREARPLPVSGTHYDWSGLFVPSPVSAGRFHAALAATAVHFAQQHGMKRLALSGGCFQNALLAKLTIEAARAAGIEAFLPQQLPPNDGAISAGQIIAAARAS
jgi:hydrogenase maturation protein HypF